MRAIAAGMSLGMLLAAASAWTHANPQAQSVASTQPVPTATSPDYSAIYCSNFFSSEMGGDDIRLISGEESNNKIVFSLRDNVFISKGSAQGVHVGDRFAVIRQEDDANQVRWFKWQSRLMKAMGAHYKDLGQVKVINVQPNVSTAQVTFACDYLQRGDMIRPMQERPAPPFKTSSEFDHFAPVSGKSVGMLVIGKEFGNLYGKFNTAYVNLGSNQGVHIGDYLRVFRYQGTSAETAVSFEDFQYKMYGFGSTPQRYNWNDLPREVVGEGIVLNLSQNSSTILITYSTGDLWAGDYVEIE